MVGLPVHLWCLDLFKKIGEICGGFIDVTCSLHDLSRVRIVVRKGSRIPVSTVVEDGYLSYRVWQSPEFRPIFMPVIATEEKGLRGGEGSPVHWIKPKSDVRSRRDGRFEIGGRRQNYNRRRREWASDAGWKGKMGRSSPTYHRAGHVVSKYRPGPPHMGPATFPNSIRIDPKGSSLFQAAHDKASKHMGTVVPPSSGHGASHSDTPSPSSSDMCPSTMAAVAGAEPAKDGAVNPRPPPLLGLVPSTTQLLLGLVVLRTHSKFLLFLGRLVSMFQLMLVSDQYLQLICHQGFHALFRHATLLMVLDIPIAAGCYFQRLLTPKEMVRPLRRLKLLVLAMLWSCIPLVVARKGHIQKKPAQFRQGPEEGICLFGWRTNS
nr:uncharacterized protein LOC117278375 isoform X2 [Nicotiana tomentosiformis]XP_033513741.1 uncharacterized protein LOC117278375 isoform X2 [Nicotiana tomentosiformis]